MDWVVALHVGAAIATAAAAGALTVLGALAAAGSTVGRALLDRVLLACVVATLLAILSGPLLLAGGRSFADPLHALYGAVALLAGPVARGAAMRSTIPAEASVVRGRMVSRGLGRWMLIGGLLTLGALLRLWTTGD